jgi:hypothetical protein
VSNLKDYHAIYNHSMKLAELQRRYQQRYLLLYADEKFGKEVKGKSYREREDGERIINWKVDIEILVNLIANICEFYSADKSLGSVEVDKKSYPFMERSFCILNLWLTHIDSLDKSQKNQLLYSLFQTEGNMVAVAGRRQFDVAEGHC